MKTYLLAILAVLLLFGCTSNTPQPTASPSTQLMNTLPPVSTIATISGDGMAVANGDTISVWYLGTLDDGTVFDTNIVEEAKKAKTYDAQRPYEPLEFKVGAGQMIKGFDAGVVGMVKGQTKTVKIEAKDAYGELRADLIQQVPLADLKKAGIEPKEGQIIGTSSGARGVIRNVDSVNVTVDFNHFLAGQALTFKITVEKITKA